MSDPTKKITLTDNQAYGSGSYLAYVAPWGKGSYKQGVDYNESIQLTPSLFPNSVVITSNWPSKPASSVYNFNAIDYGDYNGTTVSKPIASTQIKNLGTLTETHNFSMAGMTSGFDVIDDFFLTSGAGSGTTKKAEVEVLLHTPTYSGSYVQSSKPIGTFVSSGITWTVAVAYANGVPDYLFMPSNGHDVTSGTVDLKSMLDYLTAKKFLTGDEFFNGMALGMETREGSGTVTVNSFSVNYQPKSAVAATQILAASTASLKTDTGVSRTDCITSDATLMGTVAANATVALTEGSKTLGTTTADNKGAWTFQPTGLVDGAHTIVASADGSQQATVSFSLDTSAPVLTAALKSDTGTSATDRYTADATMTGRADANAVVTFMEGQTTLGTTIADANGLWTYKPAGLADGLHTIVATQADAAGNTGTTNLTFALDTAPQTVTARLANDTGSDGADAVTNDATLTGKTFANAAVTLSEGNVILATVTASADGIWRYKPTGLADGVHTIVATEKDLAGNVASASAAFTLDTKAPVLTGGLKNDTGVSATDRNTYDATLTGHAGANALVTFMEGSKTLGSTAADAKGDWTFAPANLVDGQHAIVATETDLAGNTGSASLAFWLDTKPQGVTVKLANDTGLSASDGVTRDASLTGLTVANATVTLTEGNKTLAIATADANGAWSYRPAGLADGAHTIVATEFDTAGNAATSSVTFNLDTKAPILSGGLKNDTGLSATDRNSNDPTLTGRAEANAVVTFMEGTKTLGATIAGADGAWTYKPASLADGYHPIIAAETDVAGNTTTANLGFTLDTMPPSLSVALKNDTGVSATDKITSDATLAGWTIPNGTVTVRENNSLLGAATAGANGAWSFAPGAVAAGVHTVSVTAGDIAGNLAAASLAFRLDPTQVAAAH